MDAVSDPSVHDVVIKSSAQVGKTLILKAIIGYHVDQDPAPILLLQPTLEMAEAFSKDRLSPMVRDTPVLRGKIADPKSRDSGNTLLHKRFPGGHITLAGANSPASLASRPIRIVLGDEIDRYPASAGTEGDPVNLAKKRTTTFWNRKHVWVSTPGNEGTSRIDAAWKTSDQRHYLVPCPHCGHYHKLEWKNVNFDEANPSEVTMSCPGCGGTFDDSHKPKMLKVGRWEATEAFNGTAGFALNELYSPWKTWADVVADYLAAKDHPEQLKTFVNTSLGETYAETGEAPESQRLYDKREQYKTNTIPEDVVFLTAGVDVQGDRLELEIVGWCPGKRSYSIDYRVIPGDTSNIDGDAWSELRRIILEEQWQHASGPMLPLRYTTIDSGFRTSIVYDFCRRIGLARCAPIKGREEQAFVISPPRAVDHRKNGKAIKGIKLYTIGVSVCKSELYGWLRLDRGEDGTTPPGYCHFPEYDLRHFKELTSEQMVLQVDRKGFTKTVWTKTPGVRNEPLDCRVYARAAAAIVGMDRWKEKDWEALLGKQGKRPAPPQAKPVAVQEPSQEKQPEPRPRPPAPPKRRRSSFI